MFRYDRLDQLIKETGKKKNYLSIKIGHSGRYLNDAKKQNTNIKVDEVEIIARELNTTSSYLLGLTDIKEPATQTGDGLSVDDVKRFLKALPNQGLYDLLEDIMEELKSRNA